MIRTIVSALVIAMASACSPANAPTPAAATISGAVLSYTDAFVMVPIGDTQPTMGGVTVTVEGSDVRLLNASSDAFEAIELHSMDMVDGKMRMRPAEGGFAIADGEIFRLRRGGNHMMMFNPTQNLAHGDEIDITLNFEAGGEPLTLIVKADVKEVGR